MPRRILSPALLFLLAAALRLGFLFQSGQWASAVDDHGFEEVRLGRTVAAGCGFCSPFWRLGEHPSYPSAHSPPGFPFLLAGIIRIEEPFGVEPATPTRTAALLGGLVGAMAVLILAFAGRSTAGPAGFWAVGLLAAVWPTLVRESVFPWDTPYVMLAIALGCWLCSTLPPVPTGRARLLVVGLLIGILGLFNPLVAPFLGFAAAAWLVARRGFHRAVAPVLAIGLMATVVVTPWLVRNAATFHRFIPVRNNFGLELWIGNHPGADGTTLSAMDWHPSNSAEERQWVALIGDDPYMQLKSIEAMKEIRDDLGGFSRLTLRRIVLFWVGDPGQPSQLFGRQLPMVGGVNLLKAGLNTMLLLLALLGVLTWQSPAARWLAIFGVLTLPLPFYVTHVSPNYRSIVDPLICLLAGLGVVGTITRWRGRRHPAPVSPLSQ